MTIVASQNLSVLTPDESTREYNIKNVLIVAIAHSVAQLGPFFALFFSIKGPHAWWAFAWLFLAVFQGYNSLNSSPARVVVRNNTTAEFFNYFKKTLYGGEQVMADIYEGVAVGEGCLGKYAIFVRTDAHMVEMKAAHKCFAWCIGKEYSVSIKEIDAFQIGFSMASGDVLGDAALAKADGDVLGDATLEDAEVAA